jgi:hypothetical protein
MNLSHKKVIAVLVATIASIQITGPERVKSDVIDPRFMVSWGPSRPLVSPGNASLSIPESSSNDLIRFSNSLAPCDVEPAVDCIKGLDAEGQDGSWSSASYVEPAFPPGEPAVMRGYSIWNPEPDYNIGPPTCCNLYKVIDPNGIETYLYVRVYFYSYGTKSSLATKPRTYSAEILPVRKVPMAWCLDEGNFGAGVETIWSGNDNPATSGAYCYIRMNKQYRFRLTLETKQAVTGWVETRIGEARFSSFLTGNQNVPFRFTVEGTSLLVPAIKFQIDYSNAELRDKFCSLKLVSGRFCDSSNPLYWGISLAQPSINGIDSVDYYTKTLGAFPQLDAATHEYMAWSAVFRQFDNRIINNCSEPSAIYGIVGGNALLIGSELPIWNPLSQSLDFKVLSPHYRPNGEVAEGIYEMQFNERVAQCLWGTKITPQNVSFSVVDENGQSKVATATVSSVNGMIAFRASGFTFSSSTLRATLKTTKNALTSKRLTCVKGRNSKLQLRGTTKCPKGWKKK